MQSPNFHIKVNLLSQWSLLVSCNINQCPTQINTIACLSVDSVSTYIFIEFVNFVSLLLKIIFKSTYDFFWSIGITITCGKLSASSLYWRSFIFFCRFWLIFSFSFSACSLLDWRFPMKHPWLLIFLTISSFSDQTDSVEFEWNELKYFHLIFEKWILETNQGWKWEHCDLVVESWYLNDIQDILKRLYEILFWINLFLVMLAVGLIRLILRKTTNDNPV